MMVANTNAIREEKGKQIASMLNCVYYVNDNNYKVKSQSSNGYYNTTEHRSVGYVTALIINTAE